MFLLVAARVVLFLAAIAPLITMDLTPWAVLLFGAIGQFAKAHPKIPNIAAQGCMLGIGVALYFLHNGYDSAAPNWLDQAITYSLSIPGAASVIGTAFPALQTQHPDAKP